MKQKTKRIIAILVTAAVGVSLTAYFVTINKKPEENEALLREYPISRGNITAGVDSMGALSVDKKPQNFKTPVTLEELFVSAGETVKTGDKLASASVVSLDKKLEELETSLEKARITLTGAVNNKKAGMLNNQKTDGGGDEGRSAYESQRVQAQANADGIRQKLDGLAAGAADIEARLAALPDGDPQRAELEAALVAKKAEVAVAQSELDASNASIAGIDTAREQQTNQSEKNGTIDKEVKKLAAQDLDNAVRLAQIEVDGIEKSIEETQKLKDDPYLYADSDGVVMSLGYAMGAETKLETPVAVLSDLKKVTVVSGIEQGDIGSVAVGQDVDVVLDAYPDLTLTGEVVNRELAPIKDSNPVSYRVLVELYPTEEELLEGMTANMQFIIKQVKDVLQLSNKAIQIKDGKQIVKLKNEDGTLREQEITTGFSDGKYSEVTGGLSEGDIVIVEG